MAFDPLTALFEVGKNAIDKIWPDPHKRAEELRLLEQMKQDGRLKEMQFHVDLLLAQLKVNEREAQHKSVFVAGWRPFVGWIGGASLGYVAILDPLMRFIALMCGYEGQFPSIDTNITMQVLMGMLGIGAMRSFDKKQGTSTESI